MANQVDPQLFSIPLAEAKTRIQTWQANQTQIQDALEISNPGLTGLSPLTINAFTFDLVDINDLISLITTYNASAQGKANPVNAIRMYLGIEPHPGLPVPPTPGLIAIAVTGFHANIPEGGVDFINLPQPVNGATSIFDFSYPCPTTCANIGQSILDQS